MSEDTQAGIAPAPETAAQVALQTAAITVQELLPTILAGIEAGAAASSPQAAVVAAVVPTVFKLIKANAMSEGDLAQVFSAVSKGITNNQATIDAAAKAAGVDLGALGLVAAAPGPVLPAPATDNGQQVGS